MTENLHLMVDLETLATHPRSAVMELGACVFKPGGEIVDTLAYDIEPEGEIDPATVYWWFRQLHTGEAPKPPQLNRDKRVSYAHALGRLSLFWERHQPERIWSHPCTFDVVILTEAYRLLNLPELPCPWTHKQTGDTMTLKWLCEKLGLEVVRPEPDNPHSALSDAIAQAQWLCSMWSELADNTP